MVEAVRLALTDEKSTAETARDLGISPSVLYNWVGKYRGKVLETTDELNPEEELKQLRKENARLRQEKDILKKAAVYFAKEQR